MSNVFKDMLPQSMAKIMSESFTDLHSIDHFEGGTDQPKEEKISQTMKESSLKGKSLQRVLTMKKGGSATNIQMDEDQVKELMVLVEEKGKDFNPDAEGSNFNSTDQMPYCQMATWGMNSCSFLQFYGGCAFACAFGCALPAMAFVFGAMVDKMGAQSMEASQGGSSMGELKSQAKAMIFVGVGVMIVAGSQFTLLSLFSEGLAYRIKIKYFRKCLEKDAEWYDENDPTQMASKISLETEAIKKAVSDKVGKVYSGFVGFFASYTMGLLISWKFTLCLMALLPFMIILGAMLGYLFGGNVNAEMNAYAQSAGYAEQALQAIKVVQTYGREMLEIKNYNRNLDEVRKFQLGVAGKIALVISFLLSLIYLTYSYAFFIGTKFKAEGFQVNGKDLSGGKILACIWCVLFGSMGLSFSAPLIKVVKEGQVAAFLAFKVIDHVPGINQNDEKAHVVDRDSLQGRIEFKNVNFVYPSKKDQLILKDFSCVFEAGKTTALVGPSGSGKSTIIQCLERYYDPVDGEILIDGKPMKNINLTSLRQVIGYVGQEPVLLNCSIKENMLFAKPDATDIEIEKALKDANAWDFIEDKMGSQGIEAQVGGAGSSLSGGQKQRIAIARAFLKKPKILLLDEATSALDKRNEKLVQEAIDNYRRNTGNITIIVIAHRLSTIVDADKICVIENGILKEMGIHQELLDNYPDGVYSSFCKKQASAEAQAQDNTSPSRMREDDGMSPSKQKEKDDPLVVIMKEKIDSIDKKRDDEVKVFMDEQKKISGFMRIMQYNKPKWHVAAACCGAALLGAPQAAMAIIFSKFMVMLSLPIEVYEFAFGMDQYYEQRKWLCLGLLGIACCTAVGVMLKDFYFKSLGANTTYHVRCDLYTKILQKNLGWFDQREHSSGVLTSAIAKDTAIINGISSESLGPLLEGGMSIVGGVTVAFFFCWQQALACVIVAPVMVFGNLIAAKVQHGVGQQTGDLAKEANLLAGDAMTNYKTIQSFGNNEQIIKKYEDLMRPVYKSTTTAHIQTGLSFGVANFGQYLVFGTMFYIGGIIVDKGWSDPEKVFIAIFCIMFGAQQLGNSSAFGPDMGKARGAAERIFEIYDAPVTINACQIDIDGEKKRIEDVEKISGRIEFKNVWFRYPTRKEDFVLKGLNISVNPNEQVALVGESGCGKSTFVNLLMRFYDVDDGQILLDGVDIRDYNLHDLRQCISLVMQEPIIFNYSILENILYSKLDAKNSEVRAACEVANALEFIENSDELADFDDSAATLKAEMETNKEVIIKLIGQKKFDEEIDLMTKMEEVEKKGGKFVAKEGDIDTRESGLNDIVLDKGFKTQCGLRGCKLSGGQKQRVAIARTIIRKPKILLLDEATSALDEDSQKKVQLALENAMKNRTSIIIAHRMSTIEKCDKIFVLEDGKVKEEGGFEELKAAGGFFAKLQQGKEQ